MPEKTAKVTLVGDIFPSNLVYTKRFGNGSLFLKNVDNTWAAGTKKLLMNSDIVFGNLESPLIKDEEFVDSSSFAGSEKFATTLKDLGFDVVSIANNHILEQGLEGFLNTQSALNEAKVNYVGAFNDKKSNIIVIEKNGLRFGLAAFNAIKDIVNPNLHADLTLNNIVKTIDEMNTLGLDYKLLSFHWGNEYINIPSHEQISLAHSVIDYGADVIIGHHPHVIQPIERYKNGIIIYSLGNFVFDNPYSKQFKLGMLIELFFNKGEKIDYKVLEVKLSRKRINSVFQSSNLNKKLNKYESQMLNLFDSSENDYIKFYKRKLRQNHLYQRILMKLNILEQLIFSSNRIQLFKNVFERVSGNI